MGVPVDGEGVEVGQAGEGVAGHPLQAAGLQSENIRIRMFRLKFCTNNPKNYCFMIFFRVGNLFENATVKY